MCALLCALQLLLLLLLLLLQGSPGGAWSREEGEWCRIWPWRGDSPAEAFRCPSDARFCCGTCRRPYCCSSWAARLQQSRCLRPAARDAAFTSPAGTSPPGTASRLPGIWPLSQFFLLLLATTFFCFLVCYCKERYFHRPRRYWHAGLLNYMNQEWVRRADLHRSRLAQSLGPLPPLPPLPPYSQDPPLNGDEDHPSNWDSLPPSPVPNLHPAEGGSPEDEIALKPLVHRNVAGHTSEPGSEADAPLNQ